MQGAVDLHIRSAREVASRIRGDHDLAVRPREPDCGSPASRTTTEGHETNLGKAMANQSTVRSLLATLFVLVGLFQACSGEPEGEVAVIRGKLCYPSEYIPAMTLYARDVSTGETVTLEVPQNTRQYELQVPGEATYQVFAWTADGLGGSYSRFVTCGMSVECTYHSLIPVAVGAGQAASGIDICDFYGGPVPQP
jgi:hypothetical protein